DGVAPRAKMNQQRSRRFRTAQEAQERQRVEAEQGISAFEPGESLSDDIELAGALGKAFDSNCITPGTPFMARLSAHLQYYVRKKMTEDAAWRGVKVILSGPDCPGEGEHKIMEYIRHAKAQPGYDANTRHCLYGLDADLIMLGLVTHEPHFALLREEVVFGKKEKQRQQERGLAGQNFFLMHLSLFREYLAHEFGELRESLGDRFDPERAIDDFVMLSLFVGNDFLPHLPNLHINEGALSTMFNIYKEVMSRPGAEYINNQGTINVPALLDMLKEMIEIERQTFEGIFGYDENGNEVDMERRVSAGFKKSGSGGRNGGGASGASGGGKGGRRHKRDKGKDAKRGGNGATSASANPAATGEPLTETQSNFLGRIQELVTNRSILTELPGVGELTSPLGQFVTDLCFRLNLRVIPPTIGSGSPADEDGNWVVARFDDEDLSDSEVDEPRVRILSKLAKRPVISDEEAERAQAEAALVSANPGFDYHVEWDNWKNHYYTTKLEFDDRTNPDALQALMGEYIRGIQWVLRYYYDGVASWGWFFPYHYAPHISDFLRIDLDKLDLTLEYGRPFRPFEQLMGVLPAFSKAHLPKVLQTLMTDQDSPILDFYPTEFELDFNGKKNDWEAVIKVPFIDQKRLVAAIATREHLFSDEERVRNSFGDAYLYQYDGTIQKGAEYPSSLPGVFPDLVNSKCVGSVYTLPVVPLTGYKRGLCDGIVPAAGFPSMSLVDHTVTIGVHGVKVFQYESRNETVVIHLTRTQPPAREVSKRILGQSVYVNWPFLIEGKVLAVGDSNNVYRAKPDGTVNPTQPQAWDSTSKSDFSHAQRTVLHQYSTRFGLVLDEPEVLVAVVTITGMERKLDGHTERTYTKDPIWVPWQLVIEQGVPGTCSDPRYVEKPPAPLDVEYPTNTRIFYMGKSNFGCPATITHAHVANYRLEARAMIGTVLDDSLARDTMSETEQLANYIPQYRVAKEAGISSIALSRIASSLHVVITQGKKKNGGGGGGGHRDNEERWNLGLQMKFEGRGLKVVGYTRKSAGGMWEFSGAAVKLLTDFKNAFPEFVDRLNFPPEGDSRTGIFSDTDFFAPEDAYEGCRGVRDWLRASEVANFEQVALDTEAMTAEQIAQLEIKQRERSQGPAPVIATKVIKQIPPAFALKPEFASLVLKEQKFELGDRVVSVSDHRNIPLCALGYVVGMEGNWIEVMFDETFVGGTTLNGRCKDPRGLVVSNVDVLNLSHPQGGMPWMTGRVQTASPSSSGTQHQQASRSVPAPLPTTPAWRPAPITGPTPREQANVLGTVRHIAPSPNAKARIQAPAAKSTSQAWRPLTAELGGSSSASAQAMSDPSASASDRATATADFLGAMLKQTLRVGESPPAPVAPAAVSVAATPAKTKSSKKSRKSSKSPSPPSQRARSASPDVTFPPPPPPPPHMQQQQHEASVSPQLPQLATVDARPPPMPFIPPMMAFQGGMAAPTGYVHPSAFQGHMAPPMPLPHMLTAYQGMPVMPPPQFAPVPPRPAANGAVPPAFVAGAPAPIAAVENGDTEAASTETQPTPARTVVQVDDFHRKSMGAHGSGRPRRTVQKK
ncbi:XRN 5'-3' exonuclease N-terminus-domain-containing protein, partial [Blastocladiella britannica]